MQHAVSSLQANRPRCIIDCPCLLHIPLCACRTNQHRRVAARVRISVLELASRGGWASHTSTLTTYDTASRSTQSTSLPTFVYSSALLHSRLYISLVLLFPRNIVSLCSKRRISYIPYTRVAFLDQRALLYPITCSPCATTIRTTQSACLLSECCFAP